MMGFYVPSRDCRHLSSCWLCSVLSWFVWSLVVYTLCGLSSILKIPYNPWKMSFIIFSSNIVWLFSVFTYQDSCALPISVGGLSLTNTSSATPPCFHNSKKLTTLVALSMVQHMIHTSLTTTNDCDYTHSLAPTKTIKLINRLLSTMAAVETLYYWVATYVTKSPNVTNSCVQNTYIYRISKVIHTIGLRNRLSIV